MKKIIAGIVVAFLATFGLVAPTQAADRPDYTVTEDGIQLPEGYKFEANGHVNIKWVDEDGEHSAGMHFDPNNNQPGGYFIGKSFFPFSSLIKNFDKCPTVTWIQVHGWNYHYTATPDPDKCATPPADVDDDSNNEADSTDEADANVDATDDSAEETDGSKDGSDNPTATEDGNNDSEKDGSDHESTSLDDDNADTAKDVDGSKDGSKDGSSKDADTGKDADGSKDGGEIPPTGISGAFLLSALGLGLLLVGGLLVANSRSKSAKH